MYRNIKARVYFLKAMNEIILTTTNNKSLIEWWLESIDWWIEECIPDCPSEDYFEYIAKDTELFEFCRKMFLRITFSD